MLWFKCSLVFLIVLNSANAQKFESKECLDDSFSTKVVNDGKFFGLIKNELVISKNICNIDIFYKNILDTKWSIDICREPIHIKLTSKGTQSVQKRLIQCDASSPTEFCEHWKELKEVLQDYGLIFALGERESLGTAHGKIYCSYLLVSRYLYDGYVFSKYDMPISIYGDLSEAKKQSMNVREKKIKENPQMIVLPNNKEVLDTPGNSSSGEELKKKVPNEPEILDSF
jgi:hypothetical protein